MRPSAALLTAAALFGGIATSEVPYSRRMLDSIKQRQQGIVSSGAVTSTLESGLLAQAIEAVLAQHPDAQHPDVRRSDEAFLAAVLDGTARPFAHNATWAATQPLDRFSLARSIEQAAAAGVAVSDSARAAYTAINDSLALQVRNPDGGLWYYVYPHWSYLDGMFSLLPFMAKAPRRNETDMELQIALLQAHCRTATNDSLLVHGYDWSRTAVWADPVTGASPYVWGRSLGWFLAAMVETYHLLACPDDASGKLCTRIHHLANGISKSLVDYADAASGAWWQLTALGGSPGNYLESSSTALFIFSLLKGRRIGLLSAAGPDYSKVALRAYDYTVGNFVTDVGCANGTIGFDKTVAVNSLNSTASYDYYINRPIIPNSLLGEGAFILASLEVERLHGAAC
ncbi:glycosyl hydrolase family 88 protein [Hirsutella rhossiliensis]|uniref:Glycosyl hydrolase family 88 protein n=1 Tax=Hirsutella rhossiliensis TaxID=111463 RepID=A0A9P8MMI7_9HYPO|nr:glycosyl hydrolase family 88 protein [Hirsutella rhossiliensis]KAH0958963.1 glycosyl hydrolase family 88 protein [Hirsutella rhossiliensis]